MAHCPCGDQQTAEHAHAALGLLRKLPQFMPLFMPHACTCCCPPRVGCACLHIDLASSCWPSMYRHVHHTSRYQVTSLPLAYKRILPTIKQLLHTPQMSFPVRLAPIIPPLCAGWAVALRAPVYRSPGITERSPQVRAPLDEFGNHPTMTTPLMLPLRALLW